MSTQIGNISSNLELKLDNFTIGISKAIQELKRLPEEANKVGSSVDNSIKKCGSSTETVKKQFESIGKSIENAGKKIQGVGKGLTKSITVPFAGAAVAGTKMAMDFEAGAVKITTVADTTQISLEQIKDGVLKLSNDTGIATGDLNEALYNSISAGVKTSESMEFLGKATKLSKGGFADMTSTIDMLTSVMNSYGYTTSDVTNLSDLFIKSQNLGKLTVGELSSNIGKLIPSAKAAGVGIDQVSTAYVEMTKNGVSVAESTTYVNSMINELSKTGTTVDKTLRKISGKSFKQLMESGESVGSVLGKLDKHAKANNLSLSDLFGSAEAAKAALILAGDGGKTFDDTLKELQNTTGTTEDAMSKLESTTKDKFTKTMNETKNKVMELGEKMLPSFNKLLDIIGGLLDKYNSLSPKQQDMIIKLVGMGAVLGPVTTGVGKLVSGFGGLVKSIPKTASFISKFTKSSNDANKVASVLSSVLGKAGKNSKIFGTTSAAAAKGAGALTKAAGTAAKAASGVATATGTAGAAGSVGSFLGVLGKAAITAGPYAAAVAGVAAAGYGVYKVMTKDCVPAMDLFKDGLEKGVKHIEGFGDVVTTETIKISDKTKEAVQSYIDFREGSLGELNQWYTGVTEVTDKGISEWQQKNNDFSEELKKKNNERRGEELGKIIEQYGKITTLDNETKQRLIDENNKYYDTVNEKVDKATTEQNEILERVKKGEEKLTVENMKRILELENEKSTEAIKILSESAKEAALLQSRMTQNSEREALEQAGKVIKIANQEKDDKVKAAEEEFKGVIGFLEEQKARGVDISEEQYKAIVDEAKKRKDDTIKLAEEEKAGVLQQITDMGVDIKNKINTDTGEILPYWQRFWNLTKEKFNKEVDEANKILYRIRDALDDIKPVKDIKINIQKTINERKTYADNITGGTTQGGTQGKLNTGTRSFKGGRAEVFDSMTKGTGEIIDLPRGTRVFSNDVSLRMAKETARETAKAITKEFTRNLNTSSGKNPIIEVPVMLDGREIARATAQYVEKEISFNNSMRGAW